MRNSSGVARKYPTSVLSDRNGRCGSSYANQSYFRTFSSNSGPFSSRLGNSVDPMLQQRLVNFDKSTEELFIQFTKKQRDELNSYDRQWVLENGYELEATSHYLDVRNVEAREELQRQNENLIRSRIRTLNGIKKRQKQELQKFYNQRIRERNEIIETSEIEPSDTVMSIIRNRSGVQVFQKTKSLSQSNSQINTKTKQIKIDFKKKNSKPSFFFSKTKFEDKDITIGRFKAKKKPKKEEDPNLLDIDNLNRILNAKDSRFQRIKKEKELDETCKIYEFGELDPSGMSSAYISAAGSVSSDELSLQSTRTNGSTSIAISAYDIQLERFMRHEEKTNNEINEFIEKQDILIQRQIQSSLGQKTPPLIDKTKNNNNSNLSPLISQKIVDQEISEDYDEDSDTYDDDGEIDQNQNNVNINIDLKNNDDNIRDNQNNYEYEYYSDETNNINNNENNTNSDQNKLSGMIESLKPMVNVDVNIFTKGLSSTSSEAALVSDKDDEQPIKVKKSSKGPENKNHINDDNSNNGGNYKSKRNENISALTTSKKSQTMKNFAQTQSFSTKTKTKKDFSRTQSISSKNKIVNDGNVDHLSSGRITVHKNLKSKKSKEISFDFSSKNISEKSLGKNLPNNSPQGKQQFAFRTTLEMGINSLANSPIRLDKKSNND